jgi:8-oxo-dGTP pyrophosphatase MutT (NUDIX family)
MGMPPTTPVFRPSARLIVRDPWDRILLFSSTYEDGTYWFTPGGGMKQGETPAGAAVRELAEETGFVLTEAEVGPAVATSAGQWHGHEGTVFFGADSFFFVRVGDSPVNTGGQEELERSLITGHRWWTAAELLEAADAIMPPGLPDLVTQLLTNGIPDWPVRLPWRSFLRPRLGAAPATGLPSNTFR